jgi:uncharacterized iron-regulated membrane protein
MRRPRWRRLWLKVHLYLGLTAGAVLMLLGLTGSILVFSDDIDRALNPRLAVATPHLSRTKPSLDEVYSSIERHLGRPPYMMEIPSDPHAPYLTFVRSPDAGQEPIAVHVNPQTAVVLASRQWGTFFVSFARRIHTELLVGDVGHWIVAIFGVLALVSAGTGLYLWWPRGGAWRRALTFHWHRYPAAINFELHRICGFYLSLVLVIVSLSGVYLAAPEPFDAALSSGSQTAHEPEEIESASVPAGARRLALASVASIVDSFSPGATLTGVAIPADPHGALTAYYRDRREPQSEFGRSSVTLDQYDGRILQARTYMTMNVAARVLSLQYLLHDGEIAGTAGRWLVFLCGLLPTLLFGTGVYLWWIRR